MKANRKGLARVGECSNHFMEMSQMYRAQSLNGFSNHPVRETAPAGEKINRGWAGLLLGLVLAFSAASPAAASSPGGEGIKVHGDWTITIRNPDGSLDREVQFSNALVDTDTLSNLLLGTWTVIDHGVGIDGIWVKTENCFFDNQFDAIATRVIGQNALQLSLNFSLGAECVPQEGWTINLVATAIATTDTVPTTGENRILQFTQKDLDQPITGILPDQQVTVKVVISFS